jgi:diguanylate cyclase (GGDEF)-like protein/PAS domain S-box-containing protein
VEGIDYRGVPVIAAIRAIPDSPWFLVARMDFSEVYGPLKGRLNWTILFVVALLTSVGTFIGLVWRKQRAQFYREKYEAAAALSESEFRMQTIADSAQDAILMMDPEGRISYWNPAAERILGYTSDEAIGQNLHLLIVPSRYHEAHHAAFPLFQQQGQGAAVGKTLDLEAIRKDGGEISVQLSLSAIQMKGAWHALGILRDITERKRMEAEILALSITDQLTGLHNRRGFISLAEQQLKLAERKKSKMFLFFADLDGLKWINDTLGHEEGDKALIEAATVLKTTFRTSDIIARLGGDEYAVLAVDISETHSDIFTARLKSLIDARNNQENRRYRLSISFGCSYYNPENPCSIDELMASADKSMYEQKQIKKARLLQGASLANNNPYPSMHDEIKDK